MDHERILKVYDYLCRNSLDPPGVTLEQIRSHLSETIPDKVPTALTIRRDIERMESIGYNIEHIAGPHNQTYYRMHSNGFSFNEIRFIVDSICINRFLSTKEKTNLIKKFEGLCSDQNVRKLISRITLTCRTPSSNLLQNLEIVHQLIGESRKINFEYGKFDTQQQMQFYNKRRDLVPCKVVYFNERFYLLCLNLEDGKRRTYRIDRMRRITGGDKVKRPRDVDFKYDGAVLDMFEPECFETVALRCRRALLDDILETLGAYAQTCPDEKPDWVHIRARVGISKGFFSWLMKYGTDVELLEPFRIRQRFTALQREVFRMYLDTEI